MRKLCKHGIMYLDRDMALLHDPKVLLQKGSVSIFVVVLLASRCVATRYLFDSSLQNLLQPRLVDKVRRIR